MLAAVLLAVWLVDVWRTSQPPNMKTFTTVMTGSISFAIASKVWSVGTRRVRARYREAKAEVAREADAGRRESPSVRTAPTPAKPARNPSLKRWWVWTAGLLVATAVVVTFVRALTPRAPTVMDPRVVATIPIEGGSPNAVAMDPSTNSVYVTHGNSVSVIDATTRTVTATIATTDGAQCAVAVDSGSQVLYVAHCSEGGRRSRADTEVSVIDAYRRAEIGTITVGRAPGGVAIDPETNTLYVPHGANQVSVVDATTGRVTGNVEVGGDPGGVAVDPATRTVYVANYGNDTISVIDIGTSALAATIPVGNGPAAVALDPETQSVYVANVNDGTVSVINTTTRTVTATIPVGGGWSSMPISAAVDPAAHILYVANFNSGTVSAIDTTTRAVIATVPVGGDGGWSGGGPGDVTVDPATHTAYVPRGGDVLVIDLSASSATATPG